MQGPRPRADVTGGGSAVCAPARAAGIGVERVVVGGQVSEELPLDRDATPAVIAVAKAGAGEGAVSANRFGLYCAVDCASREGTVPAAARVVFSATAAPGSRFLRREGRCAVAGPQCAFDASADAAVIAVFDDGVFGSGFEAAQAL